jgi:hypothetical protein
MGLIVGCLGAVLLAGNARAEDLSFCPTHATVLCLEKVGYNYRYCGPLLGQSEKPQEFPTCLDRDGNMCVPCWFDTVDGTAATCQRAFGETCNYFIMQDHYWDGTIQDIEMPNLDLPDVDLDLDPSRFFDWLLGSPGDDS